MHTVYIILSNKKNLSQVFRNYFLAKLFFIFLQSSETQFDLVASKLGAKLNNLLTFWLFFTLFKKFWTTLSQKLKNENIGKFIFHSFHNIAQHFGPNKSAVSEGVGICMWLIRNSPKFSEKSPKIYIFQLAPSLFLTVIRDTAQNKPYYIYNKVC